MLDLINLLLLVGILYHERKQMATIDDLKREVAEQRTVTTSAIALLAGLKQRLDEIADNPSEDEIRALAADLDAQQAELAAAISANTPVDNQPEQPTNPDGALVEGQTFGPNGEPLNR